MAKLETLTALDIGTSKVVCAIAELSHEGELEIVAKGVAPCRGLSRGALVDSEETVAAIESAISEAEKSGYSAGAVVVGLTSEYLTSRPGHGVAPVGGADGEITREDVDRVLKATSLVGIPSDTEVVKKIPRGFIVDGQRGIVNPVGISGGRLEADAYVCAASAAYLHNVRKVVMRAGLDVYTDEGLVPAALASSLAVLTDEERSLGVAMADIGLGTLDFSVYCANEIGYSSVLSKGGWILANDVACYFNIPQSEAERVIIEAGLAAPEYYEGDEGRTISAALASGEGEAYINRRELSEVLEARLQEIVGWLSEQIEFARRKLGLTVSSLVLTGGAAQLPGLAQLVRRETGIPARVATPCYPPSLPQSLASPIYSTVVGLLLYGAGLSHASDNLPGGPGPVGGVVKRILDWLNKVF